MILPQAAQLPQTVYVFKMEVIFLKKYSPGGGAALDKWLVPKTVDQRWQGVRKVYGGLQRLYGRLMDAYGRFTEAHRRLMEALR